MSKKRIPTYCLVIDASVARAAGSLESGHPTGALSRDFLIAVRSVCHRMAWSEAIKGEWDKHQSRFAAQWLVTMMNLKKLRGVVNERIDHVREAIEGCSDDQGVVGVMLKDVHLVEAALATDGRIASNDEAVRGHFRKLAATLESVRPIVWINPSIEEEEPVAWLEKGARDHRSRRLKT